jgi:hypothetical protein
MSREEIRVLEHRLKHASDVAYREWLEEQLREARLECPHLSGIESWDRNPPLLICTACGGDVSALFNPVEER